MNILFTIIILFFIPVLVKSQSFQIDKPTFPIDSLKKVLPLLHDSARVDCLNELSRSYYEKMEMPYDDSALAITRQAYTEAFAINYIKGLGNVCLQYGVIYAWHFANTSECEKYYREAISWHEKIKFDNGLGFGYWGLGGALLEQNSPDEANKAFKQSAFHFKKANNIIMLADLTDRFALVYKAKGDFEKMFEHTKKAFREKKEFMITGE